MPKPTSFVRTGGRSNPRLRRSYTLPANLLVSGRSMMAFRWPGRRRCRRTRSTRTSRATFGRSAVSGRYSPNHVRVFFDRYGEAEWDRFDRNVAGRVSLELHKRFQRRWVRKGDRVLEVG